MTCTVILHGYIEPHHEMVRDNGDWTFTRLGGLARIAALFDQVRQETNGATLALDNGDTFHGTHIAVSTRGHAMIPMMNAPKLDAMTVHWEFAYSPAGLLDLARHLDYPVLAINCRYKENNELVFAPWRIIERGGLRIGIIGIACPIVDKTMPPKFAEGLRFNIGNDALPGIISQLRQKEQVDLIVVLSHLGFPQDVKLARETDGIDVLVSGHTHNRMEKAIVENGAIIFQSGCHGSFIGRLDLTFAEGRISNHVHSLVTIDSSLPQDAAVEKMVDDALAPYRKEMSRIAGHVDAPLHRYAMLQSPMDDVLLQAIAEAADTEIAFSNGWRYGAPVPPGPVTVNDLWNIIPTNPPVSVVEITGAEMHEMLEANLERTFAADPYEQMGGYVKRIRGLKLYFKAENPKGRRIDRLFAGNNLVLGQDVFKVAFITKQGVPSKFGCNRKNLPIDSITALKQMFAKYGTVTPSQETTVFEI